MKSVKEKIDYEYELFYLDMMRTSRANIFSKSKEITLKKQIAQLLKQSCEFEESGKKEILLSCENILESAYRYVTDYETANEQIEMLLKAWLEKL